jgi:Ca-activated chloride channel family protein
MVEITFTNPLYLWTLLLIPFIIATHLFTLKHIRAAALKFSNFEAIERVSRGEFLGKPYRGFFKNKNFFLLFLRLIVYTLIIFSVTGTTIWYTGRASDFDFVLAIDTSSSMLADDFEPNRLEAAKQAATIFIDSAPPKSNIGIVSFSSTIFVEKEPTTNYDELKEAIDSILFKEAGGTNIGDTIITSANLLVKQELSQDKRSKAIILLTDGQSNIGTPVDVAVEYANSKEITIYTIGMGTEEGGKFFGTDVISKLDEDSLIKIAEQTNGRYFKADNQEVLTNAFKEIASFSERVLSVDISWILLVIALTLLAIEWLLLYTIYKTIP